MAIFRWQGIEGGEHCGAEVEAGSREEVMQQLLARGIILLGVEEVQESGEEGVEQAAAAEKPYKARKIKSRELMIFSKKFATMVEAGLPILKTLHMLVDQAENKHFRQVISQILRTVEAGSTLSDAFSAHPQVFDTIYINLLRAGEESGKLTLFLKRLVVHIEKTEKIRSKVKGALIYPIVLMTVAFCVILVMMIKVVPVFQKLFSSMGHDLPVPTQMIIAVSEFVRNPAKGGTVAVAVVLVVMGFRYLVKHNINLRRKLHAKALQLPIFGEVIKMSVLSKIAMVEGNLSAAGVPVLESLDIIASIVSNLIYKEALIQVKQGISEGKNLSELYAGHKVFPATFSQMIAVGEETGNMDEMFAAIAHYYEEEFDMVVERLTEMLEPIMIVFMGITVGFIIVAMYMPIFQIGSVISGGK